MEPHVSQGLGVYKSRPHLPKGPEGVARQAAQKEAMVERKKKKAEEARWKHEQEMEIAQRMQARENRSNVESEDPTEVGDDMIFSKEEES